MASSVFRVPAVETAVERRVNDTSPSQSAIPPIVATSGFIASPPSSELEAATSSATSDGLCRDESISPAEARKVLGDSRAAGVWDRAARQFAVVHFVVALGERRETCKTASSLARAEVAESR